MKYAWLPFNNSRDKGQQNVILGLTIKLFPPKPSQPRLFPFPWLLQMLSKVTETHPHITSVS